MDNRLATIPRRQPRTALRQPNSYRGIPAHGNLLVLLLLPARERRRLLAPLLPARPPGPLGRRRRRQLRARDGVFPPVAAAAFVARLLAPRPAVRRVAELDVAIQVAPAALPPAVQEASDEDAEADGEACDDAGYHGAVAGLAEGVVGGEPGHFYRDCSDVGFEDVGGPSRWAGEPLGVVFGSAAMAMDDPVELRAGWKYMGWSRR